MNYELLIIIKAPETMNRRLVTYPIDDDNVVGAFGQEPYAIRFKNNSPDKIEVRLSVDGTDVMTGAPASTSATGARFVVAPRGVCELAAWPESNKGGARFLFTDAQSGSVAAHTHGDMFSVGYIAAAVFVEGHVAPTTRFVTRGGWGEGDGSPHTMGAMRGGGVMRSAGTGAGEYARQEIGTATGLREPRLSAIVRVRYMWWDDLVTNLKSRGIAPSQAHAETPGFPGDRFGIDLGNTPRPAVIFSAKSLGPITETTKSIPSAEYQRTAVG